jgi:hypothetical protein
LVEVQAQMRDQERAAELIKEGRAHVKANQLAELKNVVFQLQDLLPRSGLDDSARGYGSGLLS